jgi:hypothetical protein
MSPQKLMRETISAVRDAFPAARCVRVIPGGKHPKLCFELGDMTVRTPISGTPRVPDLVSRMTIARLRRQLGTMETRI